MGMNYNAIMMIASLLTYGISLITAGGVFAGVWNVIGAIVSGSESNGEYKRKAKNAVMATISCLIALAAIVYTVSKYVGASSASTISSLYSYIWS